MKALIALAIALTLVLFGAGGYFAYQIMVTQQNETQLAAATEQKAPAVTQKKALSRMRTPKNDADVMDILSYALSKSKDAVAWLQVPGTEINNVVMQGDDNYYYERRNEDGESDIYGCYYLDYESGMGAREDFSQNSVIYGHSDLTDNPDGPRFSQLFRFAKLDFAQNTPYLYVTTQQEQFVFEIFSVFYTDADFDYIRVRMGDQQKLSLAQQAQEMSIYEYPVELSADDKLLTLSTCSVRYGKGEGKRFVVMARLLPQNEPLQEKVLLVPAKKN